MKRKLHNLVLAVLLLALTISVKAQPGNALAFNGTTQSVTVNNTLGNFGTGDFTMEAWFRTTSAGPGAIISKRIACVGTDIVSITVASSKINMEIGGSSGGQYTVIFGNTNVADGKWHHVAAQRNGSVIKLFLDGVADASNVSVVGSPTLSNSANFVIGNTSCNYFFNGSIDEVRVYNTALTQANIQADMFSTSSSAPANLQAYYNFDASSGTVLTDQTANGNNGTLVNSPSWTESYAMVVPTATAATNAYTTSLTANWTAPAVGTVTNYLLDVSTSSTFASFVSGYNGLGVSGTTKIVTGLNPSTTYYYRVRADKTAVTGQGGYSNKITTATTTNPLPPGNALNFDGTDDNVSLGTTLGNFGTGSFTVEAWFKTSAGGIKTIIGKRKATSSGNYFRMAVTNVASFEINESNVSNYTAIVGSTVVNDGKWHHVAAVRTATQILLYIDGKQEASPVTINGNPNISNSFQLSLGQILDNSSVPFEIFNGSLDEVRIWNTARTASEVQNNFMSIISNSAIGLLAYYNFDHGTAGGTNTGITTLTDQTSNANNGTLNGPFALTGATSNWVASTAWNTWTGTTSNAFATATNWQLGIVPTTVDNIVIPTGASNLPIMVTGTEAVSIAGIQTATSATVTGTLKIAGPIYNSGTLTATSGTIELNGTSAQTIAASTFSTNTVQNLTVNNAAGVTLGGALNVTGTLTPTLGALTTGGFLTLKSDATATARIATVTGSITGNVTVERYIPAKSSRTWSMVASPFAQTISNGWQQQVHITGAGTGGTACPSLTAHTNGFDASGSNAASMFVYDGTKTVGTRWTSVTGTTAISTAPGKGFRMNIRGPRSTGCSLLDGTVTTTAAVTLSTTGTISNANKNAGSFTIGLLNNGDASGANDNYMLTGNPYPSAISFSALQAANNTASGINNAYATFAPGNTVGNYAFWDGVSTFTGGHTGMNDATGNEIASGQAFFVQGKIAGAGVTLNWNESMKSGSSVNGYFRQAAITERLRIGYLLPNGTQADEIMIRFANNASSTVLNNDDILSINSGTQNIKSLKAERGLAFNTRNSNFINDTVRLDVVSSTNGNFKLSFYDFDELVQQTNTKIYLIDNYMGTVQLMNTNKEYPFTVTTSIPATQGKERFAVVFSKPAPLVTLLPSSIKIYPNPVKDLLNVQLPTLGENYILSLMDLKGLVLMQQTTQSVNNSLPLSKFAAGIYMLEVTNAAGKKEIIKIVKN